MEEKTTNEPIFVVPVAPKINNGLFSGLYFLTAPTKGGKTLTSLALAKVKNFDFLYVNEPRARVEKSFIDFYTGDGLVSRESLIKGISTYDRLRGIVIDSCSDLFVTAKKTPAIGKGLSFDQIVYFKSVQFLAYKKNVTVVVTVNKNLVPSISSFEGVSEGYIEVLSNKNLSVTDRGDRKAKELDLQPALPWACNLLGYGKFVSEEANLKYAASPNSLRF